MIFPGRGVTWDNSEELSWVQNSPWAWLSPVLQLYYGPNSVPAPSVFSLAFPKCDRKELPNKPHAFQIISETITWGTQHKTTDLFHLVSQTKTNIIQYFLYVESKKKRYSWTYLQNRNRLIDIENRLMVTQRETWGDINQELGMNIHTPLYI